MNPNKIKIFQIYYRSDQKEYLDKDFFPYDNTRDNSDKWREYWVFYNNYKKKKHKEAEYTGFLSWKFNEKTKISGKTFLDFIQNNPGYDVYFINPFYDELFYYPNVWYGADYHHPGIMDFTHSLLKKLGYNIDLSKLQTDESNTLYCNYWVGNELFWDEYIKFTEPIYEYIENHLTDEENEFINKQADEVIKASYVSFIMERMFTTFIMFNNTIKYKAFQYKEDEKKTIWNKEYSNFQIFNLLKNEYNVHESILKDYQSLMLEYKSLSEENRQLKELLNKDVLQTHIRIKFRDSEETTSVVQKIKNTTHIKVIFNLQQYNNIEEIHWYPDTSTYFQLFNLKVCYIDQDGKHKDIAFQKNPHSFLSLIDDSVTVRLSDITFCQAIIFEAETKLLSTYEIMELTRKEIIEIYENSTSMKIGRFVTKILKLIMFKKN